MLYGFLYYGPLEIAFTSRSWLFSSKGDCRIAETYFVCLAL